MAMGPNGSVFLDLGFAKVHERTLLLDGTQ